MSKEPKTKNALHKTVVLIGMMGVGKSHIGRSLAAHLNLDFVDTDAEIEHISQLKIPEIFENFGENHFRRLEQSVIKRLLKSSPMILASGGGSFIHKQTRHLIKEKAHSIWLQADINLLLERIQNRPGKRPLLNKGDTKEILQNLIKTRSPIYQEANSIIEIHNHINVTIKNICAELKKQTILYRQE